MTESGTQYKLMILYLLKKVNFPMSDPQIFSFFEEHGYASSAEFSETVAALLDSNLIRRDEVRTTIRYELTREGDQALYYFRNDIPEEVRADMDAYISGNRYKLRNETCITADYHKTENFDYLIEMMVREGRSVLYELRLTVPTEEQAKLLAGRFEENAQNIYAYIMKQLM